MFYLLKSLPSLLIGWSGTADGMVKLGSIPRNMEFEGHMNRLASTAESLTGQKPSSDVLAAGLLGILI